MHEAKFFKCSPEGSTGVFSPFFKTLGDSSISYSVIHFVQKTVFYIRH